MGKNITLCDAAKILLQHKSILILTHVKPDGDAIGSALGMLSFLRNTGRKADALFPAPLPERYSSFAPEVLKTLSQPEVRHNYDLILLLDCANQERIACGDTLNAEFLLSQNLLNIDHHVDNKVNAPFNYVEDSAAATCEITAELAAAAGKPVTPEAATLWYLGLMTDTGGFRFNNTTARALRCAAELLDAGADRERAVNAAYFSKPRNQQQFEAEMLQTCVKTALGGKYIYASIPPELFARHRFDMRNGEGLVDLLREVEGTVIAALIYRKNDVYKVSIRSKMSKFPVGAIARNLGGGGHEMAAGITLALPDAASVENLLLEQVTRLLNPQR